LPDARTGFRQQHRLPRHILPNSLLSSLLPTNTAMVPASSGLKREDLIQPVQMTYPVLWLCSTDADRVTGKRYVAAKWDPGAPIETARQMSEAPIGWPALATAPVWPGGTPNG
jgi:hypothetical protein